MPEIEESVHLLSHRPEWRIQATEEAYRISKELGIPISDIEHIGSTAVEGLVAKPIVDLMLGTRKPPTEKFHAALAALGYEWLGDFPGRSYFRKRGERNFNAHVVVKDGGHWKNNLLFRDYLRRNEAARARYAQAKQAAISSGHATLLSYSAAKEPALSSLLVSSGADSPQLQFHQRTLNPQVDHMIQPCSEPIQQCVRMILLQIHSGL